jgi:hypothetical protein
LFLIEGNLCVRCAGRVIHGNEINEFVTWMRAEQWNFPKQKYRKVLSILYYLITKLQGLSD